MEERKEQSNQRPQKGKNNYHKKGKSKPKRAEYKPPYGEEVLALSIREIGLSEATVNVLLQGGVDVLGKVLTRTSREMYGVQRFNKKHLAELTALLTKRGLAFRPDPTESVKAEPALNKNNKQQSAQEPKNNQKVARNNERAESEPLNKGGKNAKRQEGLQEEARVEERKKEEKGKKNNKDDAAFDVYKLFPRSPFVPTPPTYPQEDRFVKFQRGGKWGFRDRNGKEVIPPIYDEVFAFKEDMACVERNQAFGFINRENELVIPYKYDCASSFSEGLACVSVGEKCGYVNKLGEVVVPFVYDAGTAFKDGVARVKQSQKWGTYSLETRSVDWNN